MTVEGPGPWYLTLTAADGANNRQLNATALGASDNTTKTASVGTTGGGDYPMAPQNGANAKTAFVTAIQFKGWNYQVANTVGPAGSKRRIEAGTWTVTGAVGIASGLGFPTGGTITARVNVFAATAIGGSRFLGTLSGTGSPASAVQKLWTATGSLAEVILETTETIQIEVWYTVPNASVTSYVLSFIIGPGTVSNSNLTLPGAGIRYLYLSSLTGSAGTPTGAVKSTPAKPFTGSAGTPAGSLTRLVKKALTASAGTPAGTLTKVALLPKTGSIGSSGALAKTPVKPFSASVTPGPGVLSRRLILKALSGSITPAGSLSNVVLRIFAGSIATAGTLQKIPYKSLAATVTPGPGVLTQQTKKFFTGAITPTPGTLALRVAKALSGGVTSSGTLTQQANKFFTGMVTPVGTLRNVASKFFVGASTPGPGVLTNLTQKSFTGSATSAGALLNKVLRTFTGTVPSAGALQKIPYKPLTAAITPGPGVLTQRASKFFTGSITPTPGTLIFRVSKALSGSVTPTGALTKRVSKFFSGGQNSSGALRLVPLKYFTGSIDSSGIVSRAVVKSFTASITPVGTLQFNVSKFFAGNITPTAVAVKFTLAKYFNGYLYGPAGNGSGGGINIIKKITKRHWED